MCAITFNYIYIYRPIKKCIYIHIKVVLCGEREEEDGNRRERFIASVIHNTAQRIAVYTLTLTTIGSFLKTLSAQCPAHIYLEKKKK